MSSSTVFMKLTMNLLTVTVVFKAVLDLLTDGALLSHLLPQDVAYSNALPTKVFCEEQSVFLSARAWWSHQEYSLGYIVVNDHFVTLTSLLLQFVNHKIKGFLRLLEQQLLQKSLEKLVDLIIFEVLLDLLTVFKFL